MFGYTDNKKIKYYSERNQKVIQDALINQWKSTTVFISDISNLRLLLDKPSQKYIIHTINFETGIVIINNIYYTYKLIKNGKLYIRPPFEKDINIGDFDKQNNECPVCMENKKIMGLTCGHNFCYNCIIKLDNCPLCRKSILYQYIKRIH